MKKLLLIIPIILFICFVNIFPGVPYLKTPVDVAITSWTSTVITGVNPGRKYALFVNTGSYAVRLTTCNNTNTSVGLLIGSNGGYWEDNYFVGVSSYYGITTGVGNSNIIFSEKE